MKAGKKKKRKLKNKIIRKRGYVDSYLPFAIVPVWRTEVRTDRTWITAYLEKTQPPSV